MEKIPTEEHITLKPWGQEILWAHTDHYVGKILLIRSGHRLSRQYHRKKTETLRVFSGQLLLEIGPDRTPHLLHPGDCYHLPPQTIHRMAALDTDVEVLEVSTPELEDVVRLEDDYHRT